ncbi:MAG: BON domain-containing protein [Dehalococcoidia bacterium]|nr:BON domain-containing protein [Dehalococcoidia bacterium]
MARATHIERQLAEAELEGLIVEEFDDHVVVSGIVENEEERERALEVARDVAGDRRVDDSIDISGVMPATIDEIELLGGFDRTIDRELSEVDTNTFEGATVGYEEEVLEAGDYQREGQFTTSGWEASGPSSAIEEDVVSEGDSVFSPPIDPVSRWNPQTHRTEIIGGLQQSSMDSVEVERSASDGEYGDEAIADAIRRELREDAATTDLEIGVAVFQGVAVLRGRVPYLEDAESAEEVAARVPGVAEVREELEVTQYEEAPPER